MNAMLKPLSLPQEPTVSEDSYNNLSSFLNYYNYTLNYDQIKNFTLDYISQNNYPSEYLKNITDINKTAFKKTLGAMCRMSLRGFPFLDKHLEKINEGIKELYDLGLSRKEKATIVPIKILPKIDKSSEIIKMMEDYVENFFETKQNNKLKISDIIEKNKVKKSDCLIISNHFKNVLENINDPEYYGSTKVYNDYSTILNNIIDGFNSYEYKITRKRTKKEIDPNKLVSKVKYLESFNEYTSVLPVNVLNAKNVLIYDVRYNTIRLLIADDKLTIRGSTIYGFNSELSICKIVKKPEVFLKDINSGNIQYVINAVNAINTKPRTNINGSLNLNTIILRIL